MSNVTLLPDHMLGEVIARTHDHDATFDTDAEVSIVRIDGATAVVDAVTSPSTPTQES